MPGQSPAGGRFAAQPLQRSAIADDEGTFRRTVVKTTRALMTLVPEISGCRMVDATAELAEPVAAAAPALADDLGGDGDGGLLRRAGSKIKSDRAGEPTDLHLGEPRFAQPLETFLDGSSATPSRRRSRAAEGEAQSPTPVRRTSGRG